MINNRAIQKLRRNSVLLFWARACMSIKVMDALLSLFYVGVGLSVGQIVVVSLFWAVTSLLFEVPSSYMADRWGRKQTLLFGVCFAVLHWAILMHADGFWWVAGAMVCFGIYNASFSGTDEALLYDSKKELKEEKDTLVDLGRYSSAVNLFKMGSILIGVFIAKDLAIGQFQTLLWIDIIATVIAGILLLFLKEPNHHMDVEKMEVGVFSDAVTLIRKQPIMQKAIINNVLVILIVYTLWTYYQVFFTSVGVAVIMLGVGWATHHGIVFILKRNIHKITKRRGIVSFLNMNTIVYGCILISVIIMYYVSIVGWLLYIVWLFAAVLVSLRGPLFSEYFNSCSNSYNRSTTLSLVNFLNSVLKLPIIGIAGVLVSYNLIYPYIFGAILVILVAVRFPVRSTT